MLDSIRRCCLLFVLRAERSSTPAWFASCSCDRVKIRRSDGYNILNFPLGVTVLLKKTARVHDTINREIDGLVPLSPWSWTCLQFTQGRRE
jgi:hypothetical protein